MCTAIKPQDSFRLLPVILPPLLEIYHCCTLLLTAMEATRVMLVLGLGIAMLCLLQPVRGRPSSARVSRIHSPSQTTSQDTTASEEALGAIGGFVLNQFLRLVLNRLTEDGGLARAMQSPESPELVEVKDELVKEIEELLNGQTDSPTQAQTANTHQGRERAKAQFLSRDTWNIARECLNDILSPNNRGSPSQTSEAAIEEVKGVLSGKMGLSQASAQVRLNWPVIRECVDRFANRNNPSGGARTQFSFFDFLDDACILELTVLAVTGDTEYSFTAHPPILEMIVGDEVGSVQLLPATGDEFQRGGGDLWRFKIAEFGFTQECIEVDDVDGLALLPGGTDGWKIESIVTQVLTDDRENRVLSSDIGVDRWIDGNGGEERRRFDLTLYQ
jgi:hypothetical protein